MKRRFTTDTTKATKRIGADLARTLQQGCIIALEGNLGSGKTTISQGIAQGLQLRHAIQSPTFVLMKVYPVSKHAHIKYLVHVDCYRLASSDELMAIGLGDYLADPSALIVIEWADKIKDILRLHARRLIRIYMKAQGAARRTILMQDPFFRSDRIGMRDRGRRFRG